MNANIDVIMGNVSPAEVMRSYDAVLAALDAAIAASQSASRAMKLDAAGNYTPWRQPDYGTDAGGRQVPAPEGYALLAELAELQPGDVPFDVYSGWMVPAHPPRAPAACKYPDLRHNSLALSGGRWTTWARPITAPEA